MTALPSTNLTLLDLANREAPNGQAARIIEILSQTNEVLQYATATECNDGSGHKTTIRTGLPIVAWRKLNYGVPNSKSTAAPIRDTTGMLEAYAQPDKALIDMAADPAATRLSEDMAFLEAMSQSLASTLIYGDTSVNPERFLGLAPRFNDATVAENKDNIISGGGASTDNTSIWLVGWGERGTQLLFPRGSKSGVSSRDLGEATVLDAVGGQYQAYRTHYKADIGLCTRDWRKIVRIPNISVGALTADAASGAKLIDLMVQALERVTDQGERWTFLCNRTIRSFLRRQIANKAAYQLTLDTVAGKRVVNFDEVPVLRNDAILNTEAVVS